MIVIYCCLPTVDYNFLLQPFDSISGAQMYNSWSYCEFMLCRKEELAVASKVKEGETHICKAQNIWQLKKKSD